ncbi:MULTISPECIES: hypothetical protein [Lentzea]|uniref:Uncharacterized protein n=1 Tax=Lentzea flaviverrucosa TaxID=200379 RepID=A0A1H9CAJ3_9PSEU|nr:MULTISPECIES: hypothetical protein [Lentzea]MCR3750277.1 hypothetical protein [Lentzea californiensis]RDI24494.1 hypothetical protein DFR72_10974 [Lentzea flaviverrucosa]SEP98206.1 hypothetical protein SAMN05216195_101729 [Lentzea flaviverrucosa]
MPGPAHSQDQTPPQPVTAPRHGVAERDIALELPEWDLMPPAEFLDRRGKR